MKKVLIFELLLFVFSFGVLDAQTLSYYNSGYEIEDIISTRRADTTGVLPGNTGTNVIWDFSNLLIGSEISTQTCVDPAGTPYAASFPASNVAVSDNTGTFSFYKCDTSETTFLGMADTSNIVIYDDPMVYFKYPVSYGTQFSDSFMSDMMPFITKGEQILDADGKGTLILAGNTFNNVLRVKTLNHTVMSSIFLTMTMDMVSYNWYDCIHKSSLLTINYLTMATSMGDTVTGKSVIVSNDIITSLENNFYNTKNTLKLFPNPANEQVTVLFNVDNIYNPVNIEVVDLSGKVITQKIITNAVHGINSLKLDIDKLQGGIYIVNLIQGNVLIQKRLIVF